MDTLIYLRRSVADDDNPGAVSHEQQLARCHDLARQHGPASPTVLEDWGRSGGEGLEHRRSAYQQLRDAIATGGVRWVVSYDLSRLSRSTRETLDLVEHARRYGARIHVGDLGVLDPDDPAGRFTVTTLAASNTLLRDLASRRSKEAAMARKAAGLPVGRPPYGALPGEDAAHVIEVYHREGSYGMAARALNDEGLVSTRTGGRWGATQVRRVVRRVEPEPVGTQKGVRSRGRYTLAGLCWCWCGGRMIVMSTRGSVQLFCARGKDLSPALHPRPVYIGEARLLPWVRAEADRLHTPEAVELEIAGDEAEHGRLTAKRERVLDMFADGLIDKIGRERRLADVDVSIRGLEVRRQVIAMPAIDWSWDAGDLNTVLRAIFERIDLGPDLMPVAATWRVPQWRA